MKHARQVLREAVKTRLAGIPGVTLVASRVFKYESLPAISVYTDIESISSENSDSLHNPKRYSRYVDLVIEYLGDWVEGYEDVADDYAARIEAAMAADLTLGGVVTDFELVASSTTAEELEGRPVGGSKLNYRVWYRTMALDPETAIV